MYLHAKLNEYMFINTEVLRINGNHSQHSLLQIQNSLMKRKFSVICINYYQIKQDI
jgi:hypothetical protein